MTNPTHAVPGFDATGVAAGIKKRSGALDVALVTSRVPCAAAAVFTKNAFPAAPVKYDRQLLAFNPESIFGVVINAGNANACTGPQGDANARLTAEALEVNLGAHEHSTFVMSTGVIGVQLPLEKLTSALPNAVAQLAPDGWSLAAEAIMTTDTRPKLASRTVTVGGREVHITGMAKGAGMIHPDMATMLSVIATDVAMDQPLLQQALNAAVNVSFNRISIDGDTSTNDTVLILANGVAGHAPITDADGPGYAIFTAALAELCTELAQAIVRDGEGATKFVSIRVNGAATDADAHHIANVIATSPLVKTAFYGNDANWGRILAAVGRTGVDILPERCALLVDGGEGGARLGALQLVDGGTPTQYAEADAAARFAAPEIDVHVQLGLGEGAAVVWTSDLSHDYVSINADYRT
jgi:glutamate N-acetyltransferase/amino-acid N-acetyltransferase